MRGHYGVSCDTSRTLGQGGGASWKYFRNLCMPGLSEKAWARRLASSGDGIFWALILLPPMCLQTQGKFTFERKPEPASKFLTGSSIRGQNLVEVEIKILFDFVIGFRLPVFWVNHAPFQSGISRLISSMTVAVSRVGLGKCLS